MTKPTNAREVAAFTLFDMIEKGAWSEGALHHYLQLAELSGRDAALAARLAYGTLQNQAMCDFYIRKYSKIRLAKIKPRVLELMRMGVYQLTMLDRIPAHAATSETVKLIRKYGKADERARSARLMEFYALLQEIKRIINFRTQIAQIKRAIMHLNTLTLSG